MEQAPFGKGQETLVDTSVRSSWQIDGAHITLDQNMLSIIKTQANKCVIAMMGADCNWGVDVKLYKLVLYEEGGFFLKHQDSEKEKGHFATFLVHLPAVHQGGNLELQFKEMKRTIQTDSKCKLFSYTCFFTDVFHEIKPVTSGRRLVLAFNLVRKDGKKMKPVDTGLVQESLTQALVRMILIYFVKASIATLVNSYLWLLTLWLISY